VRRLINPHIYHVSLSEKLWHLKQELVHTMQKPT
jgi:nicotinate phosphoribosyltransferase